MSGEDRRWGSDVDGLAEPTVTVEIAEDDSSASLLLGSISREKTQGSIAEQVAKRTFGASRKTDPRFLESVYFHSFGDGVLLTRDEEMTLAKQIDQGTRRIRTAIGQALTILKNLPQTPDIRHGMSALRATRQLSGLSATALDCAEQIGRAHV